MLVIDCAPPSTPYGTECVGALKIPELLYSGMNINVWTVGYAIPAVHTEVGNGLKNAR